MFEEPHDLPPIQKHGHRIAIKKVVNPISVWLYSTKKRKKKKEKRKERMVKEMLDVGIIRVNHSLYSSPIILVKKNDGS